MRKFSSQRIWISVVAVTILFLAGSASLLAQSTQNSGIDIQYHKFVPVVPPENSKSASTDPAAVNAMIGQQVQLLMQEKASRTPAQRKIDSNVLYTIRMMRGQEAAPGVTSLYTGVDLDQNNRIVVDIVADVTDTLLHQLEAAGALVQFSSKDYRAIRAIVPADQIEIVAASPDVTFVGRKAESMVSRMKLPGPGHAAAKGALAPGFEERAARVRKQIDTYLQQRAGTNVGGTPGIVNNGAGSVDTEGDLAHLAARARGIYGVTGAGLKIGVLSDSANNRGSVTSAQATGDLPPTCPGPGGSCLNIVQDEPSGGSDEGAAMLEIVHDMAPGATLFFATADISEAGFATNIVNLRSVSACDIIVDDVFYFDESPFQDGVIAQAVTTVTAAGALYFSSAGNEGSVAANTSGYFEGDFNDAGSPAFTFPGGAKTGTIHNFGTVGTPVNGDIITATGEAYTLNWADAAGASGNDYDLFLVNSSGTVKASSTNIQSGTQNPFEQITPLAFVAGDRLVVFKVSGAASVAFALNTLRGTLTNITTGQTHGHSAVAGAYSVGAAPAAGPFSSTSPTGPFPNAFTASNLTEPFSSDGPRRQFFNPNGTPITAGNFLFGTSGGAVINKPDITAADGVSTTLPGNSGLNPFYGTSAAAPHAASIAALLLAAKPTLTPAQMRTALTSTALDIDAAGYDNVSGFGIVMPIPAMQSLGITPGADPEISSILATENPGNSNGIIEPGEGALLTIQLTNQFGAINATGITATLSTATPGVTITQPATSAYADLAAGSGTGNNLSPFTFTVANNAACGLNIQFTLTISYNGASTKILNFNVQTGVVTISNTLGNPTPVGMPAGVTFVTGQQTGRLSRSGVASVCGTLKANPGLTTNTGSRQFDAYSLTPNASACATITVTAANGINLGSVAYNSGGFTPADPSLNYLADSGSSSATQTYGVSSNAGTGMTLVVHDINVVPGSASPYVLTFPSCLLTPAGGVNHPPIAVAQNVTVTAATVGGTAAANINNGSSDPDAGDTITLSQNPPGPYPVGVTSVVLTVTDSKGAKAQATANVTVVNPPLAPTVTTLAPSTIVAGSAAFTLTVNGTNFVASSVVNLNGAAKTTTFQSSTQLTAAILAADVVSAGTPAVTVVTPAPGGGTSNSVTFTITSGNNPIPTVTTLSPTNVSAGSGAFSLTVNGTNFVGTSVVNLGGAARATTFVSSTQLNAAILAGDVAGPGTPSITVTNPAPGGGTSSGLALTVNNPVPTLTSLSPNNASAGSGAFTLTVNGTGFVTGSVVSFNGQNRVTTFVSSTQVTVAILAADISGVNFFSVNITNPAPGGGTSPTSLQFNVTTPVPAIATLAPNSAITGGAAFNMLVNGSNFISTSVVQWNGGNRTTTFVNATQLSAAITAADIATVGTATVKVFTPTVVLSRASGIVREGGPSGTISNGITFTINAANPVPTLTSIAPATVSSGGAAFTLTLTGTNFISSSVANIKGSPRVTTFVSATQLTAAITAADIAAGGTAAITVVTPTPGGGTTSAVNLTITDFSVTSPNPTQTVTAGQTANFTIATAPVGGTFTGNVTFTTSALPQGAAASFNPTSVASGSSTTMSISTTARGTSLVTRPPFNPSGPNRLWWLFAFLLTLALTSLGIAKLGRRNVKRLIPVGAFALLLISAGYLSGCAGSGFPKVGSNTGTPAGTYPITVTGTSGSVQHTTVVTLIVQ